VRQSEPPATRCRSYRKAAPPQSAHNDADPAGEVVRALRADRYADDFCRGKQGACESISSDAGFLHQKGGRARAREGRLGRGCAPGTGPGDVQLRPEPPSADHEAMHSGSSDIRHHHYRCPQRRRARAMVPAGQPGAGRISASSLRPQPGHDWPWQARLTAVKIDSQSPQHPYEQLARQLREQIASGQITSRLPRSPIWLRRPAWRQGPCGAPSAFWSNRAWHRLCPAAEPS
jgi:hypothetical protein